MAIDDISELFNFMDGIEAQERDGFKHLHQFVGRLPVPTVNVSPSMPLNDALEGFPPLYDRGRTEAIYTI